LLAATTLACDTTAVLLASAPIATASAAVPVAVAVTLPELVAVAVCLTVELLPWVAEMLIDCEMAPPATAAISASVNKLISVMIGQAPCESDVAFERQSRSAALADRRYKLSVMAESDAVARRNYIGLRYGRKVAS
jgi:hypothetical protein